MMRKLICISIFILLVCATGTATAQGWPVYDNTNFISLGKQLIESAKQTSQLLKTVEFLKQQKERIEKVNNVLKQLKAAREIVANNQRLFDMVRGDLREILNSPYIRPEEVRHVSDAFNKIIDRSLEDLEFMEQLLTSNFLEMTDAERLEILQQQKEDSREMIMEIGVKKRRYEMVIDFREMQDRINNREESY
ncbi:conjugal transfer protein [Sinomicrobium kalidii]|uniref:conjugal transfer protein n=1 Tax=Sinomicrobium kalidii TaxID=2900738 RepID=UPI001E2AABAB|nr:conjugal transfer protein [Sinomicrobium kalidii]UGU15419.1 conjugal transfer protein [Sinomicrobium kalidii]